MSQLKEEELFVLDNHVCREEQYTQSATIEDGLGCEELL